MEMGIKCKCSITLKTTSSRIRTLELWKGDCLKIGRKANLPLPSIHSILYLTWERKRNDSIQYICLNTFIMEMFNSFYNNKNNMINEKIDKILL